MLACVQQWHRGMEQRFARGRYLGEGAFGVVVEAIDASTGERVALKGGRAPSSSDQLEREYARMSAIAHPNVVAPRALVLEAGRVALAMELVVDGLPLLDYIGGDVARLARTLPQLVAALRALHAAGFVHRDVKPSNVLVDRDGRVVLVDFGLVAPIGFAEPGVGTVDYMAPEQALGAPITPAADWYAVGVLLFAALARVMPYRGHVLQILIEKQHVAAPPVATYAPEAPAHLAALCDALLAIDPARRPSGAEIAACLGPATCPEASQVIEIMERSTGAPHALPRSMNNKLLRSSLLATLATATLVGCMADRPVAAVDNLQVKTETKVTPASGRKNLDLLFVIDNSHSMDDEQTSLRQNFHAMVEKLEAIEGGLPNIHIAVVTSDLGTSNADGALAPATDKCNGVGDDGLMRELPSVTSTIAKARFIIDEDDGHGGRTRNYAGTLEETFAEIANVGIDGCGIEQHLGAMTRALDPRNVRNAGFLRDDALLAVVVIADEDDCTLAHAGLFGKANLNAACTVDAITCDTELTGVGDYTGCRPNPTPSYVDDYKEYALALKRLKADPRDVIVAGIIGPTSETITLGSDSHGLEVDATCSYQGASGAQHAAAAIRTTAFLAEFPDRSTAATICDGDLTPALVQVSELLVSVLGDTCFEGEVADLDPGTDGVQYDCSVTTMQDGQEVAVLPSCAFDDTQACWTLEENALCGVSMALAIDWHGQAHADLEVAASCAMVSSGLR